MEIANLFPNLLLGVMIILTLILLPLLNDDRVRRPEEQRTDELHRGDPHQERQS